MKKNKLVTEDGRMAERVVKEDDIVGGGTRRVTEVYIEPKPEKKLQRRITEFSKPVTHRRDIEVIDEETGETRVVEYTRPVIHRREHEVLDERTGEVIEKKIETIALDEAKVYKGSNKAFDWRKDMEKENEKVYATKADLHESIIMLAELLKEQKEERQPVTYVEQPVQQQQVAAQSFFDDGPRISAQALIEDKLNKKNLPLANIVLWTVISIQLAVLALLAFKMVS